METLNDVESLEVLPLMSLLEFMDEDDDNEPDDSETTKNPNTSSTEPTHKTTEEKAFTPISGTTKTKEDALAELQRLEQYKKDLEKIIANPDSQTSTVPKTTVKPLPKPLKDVSEIMFGDAATSARLAKNKTNAKSKEVTRGDDDSSEDELIEPSNLSKAGKEIKTLLKGRSNETSYGNSSFTASKQSKSSLWSASRSSKTDSSSTRSTSVLPKGFSTKKALIKSTLPDDKNVLTERYSGFRIINPKLSISTIEDKMSGKKIVSLFGLGNHLRRKDCDEEPWVTFGVVVHKSEPRQSQNGKKYSIWSINDLKNCERAVKFFLFGEVYTALWKTMIGSVVGLLNPTALENRNQKNKDEVAITINNSQKLLILGGSKDLGQCKVVKRDGNKCGSVVNLAVCEYCVYHVQTEYKKSSSKRMDLQSSYSGVEPNGIRNKILKDNFIYGGQIFTAPLKKENTKKRKSNDLITLDSLKLQKKAKIEVSQTLEAATNAKHFTEKENSALKTLSETSEFLGEMLVKPTAGSRNLIKHAAKEDEVKKKSTGTYKHVTAAELIKLHKAQLQKQGNIKDMSKQKTGLQSSFTPQATSKSSPCVARGFKPGDAFLLDFSSKVTSPSEVAKRAALAKLKSPIAPINPNGATKKDYRKTEEFQKKIQERLQENEYGPKIDVNDNKPKSLLTNHSYTQEEIAEITKKKSNHHFEVEQEIDAQQELYFMKLEKREAMEEKMQTITELKCHVVSCKQCQYTAHKPSEFCIKENHSLKKHEAIKRYFACAKCKSRTWTFGKIPKDPCRNCGGGNFTRTSMGKPKSGPKLDSETLLIRGEEKKFLNSIK